MVELKTTIAQGLHVTDDSAGYDAACKRVLSEKAILARIMKSCLEEYKDCDVNDIAEKYIEGQPQVSAVPVLPDEGGTVISGMDTEDKSVREGTVTYDIRFRAIVPDSEEQNCPHHQRGGPERFLPRLSADKAWHILLLPHDFFPVRQGVHWLPL